MRIVLIIVDTLRYDHLGFTGHPVVETPDLDELASQSFFFDNYRIASFPTVPNREDTNTGRYTFPHHGWGALPDNAMPLAQVLTQNGYTTQLLTDTPHLLGHGHRYHRGFQGYHWIRGNECDVYFTRYNLPFPQVMPLEKTRADELYFGGHPLVDLSAWINREHVWEEDCYVAQTARTASKWVEQNYKAKNFFLWLDTFELHEPWDPPLYLAERYDPGYKGEYRVTYPVYGPADCYTKAEIQNMKANYAGEVALISKWLGHVFRKMKDVGIYDDTTIIVTSDHGTYLGEQNRAGKMFMKGDPPREAPWPHYEGVTRIPLMIKMPGQAKGARVKQIAQPVDLYPTICDLAGVKHGLQLDGLSLAPILRGEKVKWPRKYSFSSPAILTEEPNYWTTITGEGWTLMLGGEADEAPLLYNLNDDPEQKRNRAKECTDVVAKMGKAYVQFLRRVGAAPGKIAVFERKLARFAK
ncbi:MAG: sulfatase [Candidatus Sumerlaeota bacterium]|nr:sulfatase [Candidatus Sumerlaeota bacterium]